VSDSLRQIELGPYRLLERIGEGGIGQVYRARGPGDAMVAVKILGPASDLDDAARARFRREIATLEQIKHPHLVPLLDHGLDGELGPYLVLPLLPGRNLRALCGQRALCPEAALLLMQPIASAIAALHAAGYVHRDLKPENVIAGPDGAITVIDLGLAWRDGMSRHTDTGAAVGSVGYMSPEQVEGRRVDDRADVWALGVMLYEWIVGVRPFARPRPAEEAAAVLLGVCPRLTAADRRAGDDLADLVARCLSVDPAARPSSADFAAAIGELVDWTDAPSAERAAVVADPPGYQARVATFRIRRVERVAREAIGAGKPFVAIGLCDRGLAYAPDHPALLELVATAEALTSRPREERPEPPRPVSGQPEVVSSQVPVPSSQQGPVATVVASQTGSPRAKWPWVIASVGGLVVGVSIVAYVLGRDDDKKKTASSESPSNDSSSVRSVLADGDREMVNNFLSVFSKLSDQAQAQKSAQSSPSSPSTASTPSPSSRADRPQTATGWLELAKKQQPADAVASIREALILSPRWIEAEAALCMALSSARDAAALSACDTALQRRPDDIMLLSSRATARVRMGRAAEALPDLDKIVAKNPDPTWLRVRSRARELSGDEKGARLDLERACDLGHAATCREIGK
jgi:hypothetical protein